MTPRWAFFSALLVLLPEKRKLFFLGPFFRIGCLNKQKRQKNDSAKQKQNGDRPSAIAI
jgi:hypothetical protein